MASVLICDLWENIPVPHAPFQIPPSTFHISHPTSNISHPTSNIPHSQHPSPKSTRFFPSLTAPCPNTPFSARHCNRLTINHLPSKDPRATFQTLHSPPRNAIFRPSIPALSKPHPLPFAPRSLSPRNPIHAPTPTLPLAYGLSTRPPFRLRNLQTAPSRPLFHPKSRPHISTKYF